MLLEMRPFDGLSLLPVFEDTLPLADLFHRAIVGRVGQGREVDCPDLTGRDAQGEPLKNGHRHAHVIPLALRDEADGQLRLDHILIHAPMGLSDEAQRAIRSLSKTWTKGGAGDLQVALSACGEIGMLRLLPEPLRRNVSKLLGPESGCCEWISATPFVLPRFRKNNGSNSLVGQVSAELHSRGLPEVVEVSEIPEGTKEFRHFVLSRQHGGKAPPQSFGHCLRLKLASPLRSSQVPLALGYGAHFGLGLFWASSS